MTCPFTVTREQIREAQAALAAPPRPATKRQQMLFWIVVLTAAALFVVFDFNPINPLPNNAKAGWHFHFALGLALLLSGIILSVGSLVWSNRTTRADDPLSQPVTAGLIDGGIFTQWPGIRHEMKWEYFEGCVETENLIVFRAQATTLFIFPKSVFDEDGLTRFREEVRGHLPLLNGQTP